MYIQPSLSGMTFNICSSVSFTETNFPGTYCIQNAFQMQLTCISVCKSDYVYPWYSTTEVHYQCKYLNYPRLCGNFHLLYQSCHIGILTP